MSPRVAWWLAWSIAGLAVAMFLVDIALYVFVPDAPVSESWGIGGVSGELMLNIPYLAFPIGGALIASRYPGNVVGWFCLSGGFLSVFSALIEHLVGYDVARPGSVPFALQMEALSQWFWVPTIGLVWIFLILYFPNGRLPSRRWRPFAWFSGVAIALAALLFTLSPGPLLIHEGVSNPFGLKGQPWVSDAAAYVVLLLPVCCIVSAFSLVMRYRNSVREQRQQIKWVALAASFLCFMALITVSSSAIFSPGFPAVSVESQPFWVGVLQALEQMSVATIAIAGGIAILRYRLYDIDRLINKTLVYVALTVLLAGTYLGSVVSLQYILRMLTGETSQLAIVASTLVISALFVPLRRRIQRFIDRRFYRQRYDAAKTLEAFSKHLRDETDLDELSEDLVRAVRNTVQPAHVSVWLRETTEKKA